MSESDNSIDILVPDIGDADNVEIIEILVAVGDQVNVDDSLLTLESDKASMEVPATRAGVIDSLSISVGDTVSSGDVIGTMSPQDAGDSPAKQESEEAEPEAGEPEAGESEKGESEKGQPEKEDPEEGESAQQDPASDKPQSDNDANAPARKAPDEPQESTGTSKSSASPASPAKARTSNPTASPTAHLDDENMRKAHASPGVRRYARELGADLSLISGTGPKGRISKSDVTAFIKQALEGMDSSYRGGAGAAAGGGAGIPPIPEVDFSKFGEIERVELGRINKLSAANLHRAWLNLPMVTHHDVADVTDMEAFRKQLKDESREGDPKVTGLAFHMKALVKSLQAFPKLNSSLSADGEALFYKHYYHIGIAVDTPNGLVVPVFRDVDKKSIHQLADEMSDVSARARQKKLKPDEMQGASMTISSLGGIGGTAFTPIVNPPEVAILGITRATMQPVWNGSEFIPRLMCPLDLTYDHRVVDGADAARFMACYIRQISDIRRLTL